MYTDEKNPGINWKDIIIKAIFAVAFVLLLIWLFPKVPNMTPFYSNVFRENIKYMQDAAESYYTNEKLPKNVGESRELTLKEMIDQQLILPFVDKDGKECDTSASYARVTKNKNDYTLTVNLVCPSEKNTLKKTLGCYTYCEDCDKEKVALEYQFKRAITSSKTTYSCPNGGSLSGKTCSIYKDASYKATENKSADEYYCLDGSKAVNGKCNVTETKTIAANSKTSAITYTCDKGGTLNGTTCTVNKNETSTYEATKNTSADQTYSATKTTSAATTYAATKTTTGGGSYSATATSGKSYLSGTYYSKPSGYTCSTSTQYICSSSSNCPGYTTVYTSCYTTRTTYSCPNGGSLSGTTCTLPSTTKYTCSKGGTLSGTTCTIAGTTSYSCPKGGTLSGTTCTIKGSTSYNCSKGGTLSGTTCTLTSSSTTNYAATKHGGETTYSCENGVTPKNGVCTYLENKTIDAQKTLGKVTYTCPKGGTLKDKTCALTVLSSTYAATASTKKSTSYEYKWAETETLEGWVRTGETRNKTN